MPYRLKFKNVDTGQVKGIGTTPDYAPTLRRRIETGRHPDYPGRWKYVGAEGKPEPTPKPPVVPKESKRETPPHLKEIFGEKYKLKEPLPPPTPEVIDKDVPLKPRQSVTVTYEIDDKIYRGGFHARDLQEGSKFRQDLERRGGRITQVESLGREGVVFKAPTSKEWEQKMKDYYKERYEKYRYIPQDVREQVTLPSEYAGVEQRGKLERLIERRAYEQYLGVSTYETEQKIESLLRGSRWYMGTQMLYGEDGKPFFELKKEEPALYLSRRPSGELYPKYDIKRWRREEEAKEKDIFVKAWRTTVSASFAVFDPGYWGATIKGRGAEYLYEKEYGTMKAVKSGDIKQIVGKWAEVQVPVYETVILPLMTAGAFKYISAGYKVAKTGTITGGAYKYFVTPTTKVIQYGAIPTIIGTELGTTAAYEVKGYAKPGTTLGKALGVTTGFTVFGLGLKYWDVPSKTLTHMSQGMKRLGTEVKATYYEQFPGAKKLRLAVSEFKQYGIQRHDITWLRWRYKYFGSIGEKVSQFKFDYRQVFREQFPRTSKVLKGLSEFKQRGVWVKEDKVFEGVIRREIKPSDQYSLETYVKAQKKQILKYPAEGTDLKGMKPFDYIKAPPDTRPSIKLKQWKVTKADLARFENITMKAREALRTWKTFEGISKSQRLIQTKLSTMKDYNIQLETYLQGTKQTMKPFEGFKPPKPKPMTAKEIYTKIARDAKAELLKTKTPVTEQKTLQIEYMKSKYLITAKGDQLEVIKLETPEIILKSKTPLKFGKVEITLKDVVGKKPVTITTLVEKTKVPVTEYEWYQSPLKEILYTPGDLRLLSFLEEAEFGIAKESKYWKDVKPVRVKDFGRVLLTTKKDLSKLVYKPEIKREKKREPTRLFIPTVTQLQTQAQDLIPDVETEKMLSMSLKRELDLLQKYKTRLDRIITPTTPPPYEPPPPPPPIIIGDTLLKKRRILEEKKPTKGYNVYVKERTMYHGKIVKPTRFKKMNVKPLTRSDALSMGGTLADESAAISFKIKPTTGEVSKPSVITKPWHNIKHKFTKKGNIYIEKTKYRIDTPGEIKGITALGWKSKKEKRKKNVRYI